VGKNKKTIVFFAFLLVLISCILPPPQGLNSDSTRAIAAFLFAIILWVTDVAPPSLTGMAVMVMMPLLGVISFEAAVSGFASSMIWIVIGISLISLGASNSGLDRRIAYNILNLVKGRVYFVLLLIILITFISVFFLPSSVGRTSLLVPICIGLIKVMELKQGSNVAKIIFIGMPLASIYSSTALITGGGSSIITAQLFEKMLGYHWSYVTWMIYFMPITILMLIVLYFALVFIYPPEVKFVDRWRDHINTQLRNMGRMNNKEKTVSVLLLLMILLLITSDWHQMPVALIIVATGVVMCLPPVNVLVWEKNVKLIDWDTFILFGASLSIAESLQQTGAFDYLAKAAFIKLNGLSPLSLIAIVVAGCVVLRFMFSNMTGMTAAIIPVIISISKAFNADPVIMSIIALTASNICILLPTQSPNLMLTYGLGVYDMKEFGKIGLYLLGGYLLVISAYILFYLP